MEQASSALAAQVSHYATWRRLRSAALVAVAFLVFLTIWFCRDLAVINSASHQIPKLHNTQQSLGTDADHQIPPKIWQIVLPKGDNKGVDPGKLKDTASWLALNPKYTYTLVDQKRGQDFLHQHFASEPAIIQAYNNLGNVGMKSDLLRYLILDVEGGVYTDTDTVALKPIDSWVPKDLADEVRLIVGIEFDRRNGPPWADISHWVQFCQWTIAATPGHPIFRSMVDRILDSLDYLSEKHKVPINEMHPTSFDVMNSTGPAAWTDIVFEQLQKHDPSLNTTKDLSYMTKPKVYGDILVLDIDGFGMGQAHSHSTNNGSIPEAALAKHLFHGSWRGD